MILLWKWFCKNKKKNEFEEVTKARKESQEKKAKEPEATKVKLKNFNEKYE